MSKKPGQFAFWFSASYCLVSAAWIFGSDRLVEALFTNVHTVSILQTYKGLGFVVVTAGLIFVVLKRALER